MFARTPRLFLRPGWLDDAPAVAAALSDRTIARTLAHVPADYGIDDARAWLSPERPRNRLFPEMLAFLRTRGTPRLVGACGLVAQDDGSAALGYWIARPYWGLGFATEAGQALVEIARTVGHERIVSEHHVDNPASGRVLRKLGFVPTGDIVRRMSVARNEMVPSVQYALAADSDLRGEIAPLVYPDLSPSLAA